MIDVKEIIGIPYKDGGRDLKGMDCCGVVLYLYKKHRNIILPDYLYECTNMETDERIYQLALNGWPLKRIEKPEEMSIIGLKVCGNPSHVGVYVGEGMFVHATRNSGVCLTDIRRWQNRIEGFYKVNS